MLRDLVWDTRTDGFDPSRVADVDLAFFDPTDLSVDGERAVEARLGRAAPAVPWEARNQAAVHTWYHLRFGARVEVLTSTLDGVATWPETATAVAVRLCAGDRLEVHAPFGLDDLLGGVLRRNPRRVGPQEYARRLERKQVTRRWPHVTVVTEGETAP